MVDASFPKSEKLYGKLPVEHLYKQGKRFVAWPLRVSFIESPDEANRILVWAPKSLFRHAVDRNRLRRLMREAYRLNKSILYQNSTRYHIAFNYMDKSIQDYQVIAKAMCKALNKLNQLTHEKNY
jgi:ribonuclease P protein component